MTLPNWSAGYQVNREYGYVFSPHMAPANLLFTAAHRGVATATPANYRYFELGCGFGLMSLLFAATNPDAEFWANDFMPDHVLEARSIAEEAELTNVQFLEKSFEELLDADLPEFDVIALHGVYSWVNDANRARIREFLRRHLKTGGLVYVSYNHPVGFAPIAPLRRLLNEASSVASGSIEQRVQSAFELVARLAKVEARYFEAIPHLEAGIEQLRKKRPSYLIHEFFNSAWSLCTHSEVARDFKDAKLSYVASARLLEDLWQMVLTPEQIALLRTIPDRTLQEDAKDFILNTNLRRDLFARGLRARSNQERRAHLLDMRFALTLPRDQCAHEVKSPLGKITLLEHVHTPLLDALAEEPHTLRRLTEAPSLARLGPDAIVHGVLALVAAGYASPALPESLSERAVSGAQRFNRVAARRSTGPRPLPCLASAVLGSGVPVSTVGQLFHEGSAGERSLPEHAWARLSGAGQSVSRDGVRLEGTDASLAELRHLATDFARSQQPTLRQLGVA
ncbi:MAG TPA: class I SAM-dependent methyltransferase [Polyangiaceae bacterium]|nr:class I SAM-dependent methyltransferase [Polyangiaceae bacterium]